MFTLIILHSQYGMEFVFHDLFHFDIDIFENNESTPGVLLAN